MTRQHRTPPPFSPVLLAGLAMRPLPPALLQPALNAAITAIHKRRPYVFDRLEGLDNPNFLIDPIDLPFVFILTPDPQAPTLKALRKVDTDLKTLDVTATIRGPLLILLDLLEGNIDGDAQFFSRDLVIEGDTEAVVALRNAVDGAEVDVVGDMLSMTGPFAGPARRAVEMAGGLFMRAGRDLETLRASAIAPAMKTGKTQSNRLNKLEEKVNSLARQRRKAGSNKA